MTDRAARSLVAIALSLTAACATEGDSAAPPAEPWDVARVPSAFHGDIERGRDGECRTTIDDGLVCTTCGRGRGARRECMPGQCGVVDRCLRCVDPRGRAGVDCSIDYETLPAGSFGIAPGNVFSFATCTFLWGIPSVSGTTCHYPGRNSCTRTEEGGGHCIHCTYADGSGTGLCNDASEPLPAPLADRPRDLPRPGTCVTEREDDGRISCTTCTNGDLSAIRACHDPGAVSCDLLFDESGCLGRCTLTDGSQALLCNSDRGPELVPLPSP
jgi:hypothetical protein